MRFYSFHDAPSYAFERPKFKMRILRHIPTNTLILQTSEQEGISIAMYPGYETTMQANKLNEKWNLREPNNYVPFNGVVIISNDDVPIPNRLKYPSRIT
jgi:hypothetical protein